MRRLALAFVVGTRPNLIKAAPLLEAVDRMQQCEDSRLGVTRLSATLIHTGQHYSPEMSEVFFRDLGLRQADIYLNVGSGSHAEQTGRIMMALEKPLLDIAPRLAVLVGDVNSTLAAALVCSKLSIPIAHVEAGLRSGDRDMPEEVNRIVTDHVSRLLFTTSEHASRQLWREGIPPSWVHFVGNTMIDALDRVLPVAARQAKCGQLGLDRKHYALATLHRPSNVDDPAQLNRLMSALGRISRHLPVVFPVHARTAARLRTRTQSDFLAGDHGLRFLPPLAYVDFLSLMLDARLVLTDSGGVQAEACVVGTPCVTLRTTTEWRETLIDGVNRLVDPRDEDGIYEGFNAALLSENVEAPVRPRLWDGNSAQRVVSAIAGWGSQG